MAEERKLLDSPSDENELEDKEIEKEVSSEITRGYTCNTCIHVCTLYILIALVS